MSVKSVSGEGDDTVEGGDPTGVSEGAATASEILFRFAAHSCLKMEARASSHLI